MKAVLVASLLCSSLVACSGSDGDDTRGKGFELEIPARGFQLKAKGKPIPAGDDVEYCEVVQIPGSPSDVYYTNHFEAALTPFSHHLNVYAVDPEHAVNDEVQVGDLHECLQPNLGYKTAGAFGEGFAYIAGSSRPYTEGRLPEGVGKKLYGGQKLIFNYHYLNTSAEAVPAGSILNIHTIDAESIVHRSQLFALLNQTIDIPARDSGSFTMECTMRQDVFVYGLSRHTHRWGKDFETWFVGGDRAGEHVFTSSDWEANTGYAFDPPRLMRSGEGFRFRCDFDNTTDAPLKWGDKATEEMCILYGSWYVANPGEAPVAQSCIALPGVTTPGPDGAVRGFPIGWPSPDLE
ncbi:MAG TPA: hypothetical protein VI072_11340 [Polyangiaceae bacterium]